MEILRTDLEALKERFEDRKEVLSNVLDAVKELMDEVTKEISELDTAIHNDIMQTIKKSAPKKIDPKFCTHVNKKVDTYGNAETVTCEDCDLLLSFKQL